MKPFSFSYTFPGFKIVGVRYNKWFTETYQEENRLGIFWYFGYKVFSWKQ